ncbi:MAG: EamA family transporter [Candidatus Altiarchaeota archaeon]|nr:EamA family transporter [Candidatus Altiarchaeota archaeon]
MVSWILISILGAIGIGILNYFPKIVKTGPIPYLSIQFLTAGIILLPFAMKENLSLMTIGAFALVGVLSLVANMLIFYALKLAPNPGYAYTIVAGVGGVVLFSLASIFLGESLTASKLVGAVLVLIGAFLLMV